VYKKTVELPFLEGGYILAYQRCCRNQSLINIIDPNDYGATYWTAISEESLNTCNSSPVFKDWPPIYLCASEPVLFDHSATDADGDSLVYRLCMPYSGATPDMPKPQPPSAPPYDNIFWASGYSLENMMGGDPLTIDSINGQLDGLPTVIGQFVVGICAEEYRDGVLIGRTYRDFQFNTRICLRDPIAEFVPDTETNCEGYEITFDNLSTEGSDATWFFDYPNTNLMSNETNPTVTYNFPGLYQVALFVSKGDCIDSTFIDVGVSTPNDINLDFNVNYETCQDGFIIGLENMSQINQEVISAEYLITSADTSFTVDATETSLDLESVGAYTVVLQVETISGCSETEEQVIEFDVSSEILLPVTGDGDLCGIDFSLSVDINSADIEWFSDPEMTQSLGTDNPITLESDDYDVTDTLYAVQLNANCTNFTSVPLDIIVSMEDLLEVTGSGNICDDEFTLLVLVNNIEVEWFSDPGLTQSIGTDNPIDLLSNNFEVDDTLYVVELNSNCINFTAVPLDIVPSIGDVIVVEGEGNFCEEDFTLNVMTPGDYAWYDDPELMNEIGNTNPLVLDPADFLVGDTLYVVQTSTICPNITAVPLNLITNEGTLDLEEDDVLTCVEDIVELNPDGNPDYSYTWTSIPDGAISDPSEVNPSVNVIDSTVFYVEAVVNGSCIIYDTITVNPQILSVEVETDTIYYCVDDAVVVSAVVEGAIGITWIDENNEIVGGGDSFTYLPVGTETLTVFVTNQIACDESTTLTLIPYEFSGEITGDNISCIDEEITLMVDYEDPLQTFTYTWLPETVFGENTTGNSQTNMYEGTTDVLVMVENQIGCTWEITYEVILDPFESFEVEALPNDILLTETTKLEVDDIPGATYVWEPEEFLDDPSIYNPLATPTENVVFTVTVTNENGCVATDTVTVRVTPPVCDENDIFVPNTFTPNGDGLNDRFKVESNFIDEYEIIIYNRWGEEVYSTTDPDDPGWDGTFKNTELEADVFGYHLRVLCIGGDEYVTQGNISILK